MYSHIRFKTTCSLPVVRSWRSTRLPALTNQYVEGTCLWLSSVYLQRCHVITTFIHKYHSWNKVWGFVMTNVLLQWRNLRIWSSQLSDLCCRECKQSRNTKAWKLVKIEITVQKIRLNIYFKKFNTQMSVQFNQENT